MAAKLIDGKALAGRLCGDVCCEESTVKVFYVTPHFGGTGSMTNAVLMKNTLTAAKPHLGEGVG